MKFRNLALVALFLAAFAPFCLAQTKTKPTPAPTSGANPVKFSPAYAEVLLRKTELFAELEALLVDYTEEFPKVKELRFEGTLLQKEIERLLAVKTSDGARLSAALGKLMVRKCEIETDLWSLSQQFNDQHPDVKRARRKAETFEAAISDILQGK